MTSNQQNDFAESGVFRTCEAFKLQPQTPCLFEDAYGSLMNVGPVKMPTFEQPKDVIGPVQMPTFEPSKDVIGPVKMPTFDRQLKYGIDEALGFNDLDWSQMSKLHPTKLDPWRPIEQR